jgi:nucleoside-diphosphate-sugar epimerase
VGYLEAAGVGGTQRVLAPTASEAVGHLVHVSSVGAYAPKRDAHPVDEQWPVQAVPSSSYSWHKVAAENLLDAFERSVDLPLVTRLRPGIIGQTSAGSALLRYALPALFPARILGAVPVLPLPAGLTIPMVDADDVADAILRVLQARSVGSVQPGCVDTCDSADDRRSLWRPMGGSAGSGYPRRYHSVLACQAAACSAGLAGSQPSSAPGRGTSCSRVLETDG